MLPSFNVIVDLSVSRTRRNLRELPVGSIAAPSFVVTSLARSIRLEDTFCVAIVVQPSLLDASASASLGSDFFASIRVTNTSTLASSEKGKGASVRRTLRRPMLVPDESAQASVATKATGTAVNRRKNTCIYELLKDCFL